MQRICLIAASLLTLMGPIAHADNSTVFGMELQKPFNIVECPYQHITKTMGIYNPPKNGVCYETIADAYEGKGKLPPDVTVRVTWPLGSIPIPVTGLYAIAKIIGGNLESLSFNTLGIKSQERDLQILSDKYGKPTAIDRAEMQNGFGAKFESIRTQWDFGDVVVSFDSSPSTFNSGLVRVETRKAIADTKAALEKLHQNRPSL